MKILFTSLGCAKNLIDSEQMLALLADAGHVMTGDIAEADAAVVNTCAFVEAAQQEAIDTILNLAQYKTDGNLKRLIVTGCLAQRYKKEILEEIPEIDAVLGTGSFPDIVKAVESEESGYRCFDSINKELPELDRIVSTGPGWAYIKIADGCDNTCAYCVIPSIRGRFRSRPLNAILNEARSLASSGIKELILVAQDVSRYGADFKDGTNLCTLLRELESIEGLEWIRLHYLYPDEVTEELIDLIAASKKILHYFDIPIQHVNDEILHAMKRRETKAGICELFNKIRKKIPDAALRTSLIVGLPGESEAEFTELMDFLREVKLDRAGVFTFSPQENTLAARLPGRCSEEEAEQRRNAVMELQARIMDDYDNAKVGRTLRILCEGHNGLYFVGRSYADSPDVDEQICFTGEVTPGEFVDVKILSAEDGILIGAQV